MSQEPVLIAVAVVRDGPRVLIGPRPDGKPLAGLWEFPGGKILPGEAPQAAAERECREETGLDVRVVRAWGPIEHHYSHALVRLHFFEAVPGDPVVPPRAPFVWVAISELENYAFPPANAAIVAELIARNAAHRDHGAQHC